MRERQKMISLIENDPLKTEVILTVAATNRRSLNITSFRQSKSLCFIKIDPKMRASTFENFTQTLTRRPDNMSQLTAALLRRRRRVSGDVAETWRHTN